MGIRVDPFDKTHLWHPYDSATDPLPTYTIKKAYACTLELADGRTLIEGTSSWWCALHGYNHPLLNQALIDQLEDMAHVMFAGLTHQPAITLGKKLLSVLNPVFDQLFYVDSGSVAVEVALKMALQYRLAEGNRQKTEIATFRGGYHGDTWNTMSVSDPKGMHQGFHSFLPVRYFVPRPVSRFSGPWQEQDNEVLKNFFAEHHEKLTAFIVEPIVQGAGGMYFYHPHILRCLRQYCDQYNILLIFDEIATGFARTGRLFAYEYAQVTPDILCLGKALSAGYLPMALVATVSKVAHRLSEIGSLMHGPTFMANPLACAVAISSLDLLLKSNWRNRVEKIEQWLEAGLAPARDLPEVKEVRVLGAIGVIELTKALDVRKVQTFFVEKGIWLRPFGNLIYIIPPLIIRDLELDYLCTTLITLLPDLLKFGSLHASFV